MARIFLTFEKSVFLSKSPNIYFRNALTSFFLFLLPPGTDTPAPAASKAAFGVAFYAAVYTMSPPILAIFV